MTNREIRSWYLKEVTKIAAMDAEWVRRGGSLAQRAHRAWQVRHDLRLQARAMMTDPIEVEHLCARDAALYGNPGGPPFEDLAESLRRRGLRATEIFQAIIESASRTDGEMNALLGIGNPNP